MSASYHQTQTASSGSASSQSRGSTRTRPFARGPNAYTNPNLAAQQSKAGYSRSAYSPTSTSQSYHSNSDAGYGQTPDYRLMPFDKEFLGEDDALHDFDRRRRSPFCSWRGIVNVGTLLLLAMGILMLFLGYPVLYHLTKVTETSKGGFGMGGTNMTGQIPAFSMRTELIDPDTPPSALTRTSFDGEEMELVFSDEFNTDGRSFYPGDDPFWEAIDLHAHGTGDYEWYSPDAVTTSGGNLVITAIEHPTHNLNFRSGHLSSWNKMCITGGAHIEVSVQLPGSSDVSGWWPAVWTMGNLGRANYGATTEGTWPYSYDACDLGTLMNQTNAEGTGPRAALTSGDTVFNTKYHSTSVSFLPGQRLSSCTCPGDDHPGPVLSDGTYKARSAPEIDIIEAQVGGGVGHVSQSGQFAPFNAHYELLNGTSRNPTMEFFGDSTLLNSYQGNVLQQSASAVTTTPQRAYQLSGGEFATYGVEWREGYDDAYLAWTSGGQRAWRLNSGALEADTRTQISRRPVPGEPMYIILNLALSQGFGDIDWRNIVFPGIMLIDYVRVWQPKGKGKITCDPPEYPTQEYINRHWEAYNNPNLTIWGAGTGGYNQPWPRNRLYPGGCSRASSMYPGPNRT
ncbi:unnamed protein product [Parajaminaea phylloscopi]